MREIYLEIFGKDEDVSMEIRIVTYKGRFNGPNTALTQRVISYAHLSDDKPQIAVTTFINTEQMFEDIYRRQELTENDYTIIIFITNGCAGQYKSGKALFMLAMHAQSTGFFSGSEMRRAWEVSLQCGGRLSQNVLRKVF